MLYTTPFLRLAGTGSLGYTSSGLRVLKERKVTWMARGVLCTQVYTVQTGVIKYKLNIIDFSTATTFLHYIMTCSGSSPTHQHPSDGLYFFLSQTFHTCHLPQWLASDVVVPYCLSAQQAVAFSVTIHALSHCTVYQPADFLQVSESKAMVSSGFCVSVT